MTPIEPGTPQTAAGRALHRLRAHDDILPHILAIEVEARSARDAEIRAAVEGLPEPTLGLKGGVSRAAVFAILDAASQMFDVSDEVRAEVRPHLARNVLIHDIGGLDGYWVAIPHEAFIALRAILDADTPSSDTGGRG